MKKIFKPTPLKIFIFIILFLFSLSIEPSDISFKGYGTSETSLLRAIISSKQLQTDSYLIIILLLIASYLISCLAIHIFSEEAIEVWKRK